LVFTQILPNFTAIYPNLANYKFYQIRINFAQICLKNLLGDLAAATPLNECNATTSLNIKSRRQFIVRERNLEIYIQLILLNPL